MVNSVRPRSEEPLNRGERRVLILAGVVVLLIGALVAGWTVYQSAADRQNGCVSVDLASSTGSVHLHYCGTSARQWCAAEFAASDRLAQVAHPACAAAGYRPQP